MPLAWLMLGRFALGKRRMSRSQLDRTLLLWVLPLLIAPPMRQRRFLDLLLLRVSKQRPPAAAEVAATDEQAGAIPEDTVGRVA